MPRMSHNVASFILPGQDFCHGLSCIPAHSSLPEAAGGRITAHGALHEPAQRNWILGPGVGSASGASLKSYAAVGRAAPQLSER